MKNRKGSENVFEGTDPKEPIRNHFSIESGPSSRFFRPFLATRRLKPPSDNWNLTGDSIFDKIPRGRRGVDPPYVPAHRLLSFSLESTPLWYESPFWVTPRTMRLLGTEQILRERRRIRGAGEKQSTRQLDNAGRARGILYLGARAHFSSIFLSSNPLSRAFNLRNCSIVNYRERLDRNFRVALKRRFIYIQNLHC